MMIWLPRRIVPVLMYHRLGEPATEEDPALWVSVERFALHLEWIASSGFTSLSLEEAHFAFASGRAPRRRVLITVDDAFAETLEVAMPMLADSGLSAAAFVAADTIGRDVGIPPVAGREAAGGSRGRVADLALLRAWLAAGHQIGAHSASHAPLVGLDPAALSRETLGARQSLESALGREVLDFCYPYARHDAAARRAVAAAGFRSAYAGEPPTLDLFALPRMMVFPDDDRRRYQRKLSGFYYFLSHWHRALALRGS